MTRKAVRLVMSLIKLPFAVILFAMLAMAVLSEWANRENITLTEVWNEMAYQVFGDEHIS